jgi:N-acetyl-alpha-D-muramate 1-phosphate uridylyltransferase
MKAMILAAGLGKRMRPLTDATPKPLLKVAGKTLIEYHIEAIAAAGIKEIVINTHWLGEKIPSSLGDGSRWQVQLHYSHEDTLLETAGGIVNALQHLDNPEDAPFLLVNGDIFLQYDLINWMKRSAIFNDNYLADILLIKNPPHNPNGDFGLAPNGLICEKQTAISNQLQTYTYCGVGLYRPSMFRALQPGPRALGPILREHAQENRILGSLCSGLWVDVGTPERLEQLNSTQVAKRL